jgi:hypothetical protein
MHGPRWGARRQKDGDSTALKLKDVFICDVELQDAVEQNINRVLEYLSCPMPALEPFSKHEQRRQMRKIVRRQGNNADYCAMLAHCSSVKELRYVAQEEKKYLEKQKA